MKGELWLPTKYSRQKTQQRYLSFLTSNRTGAQEQVNEANGGDLEQGPAPQATLNPELMREIAVEVDADTVSKAFRTVVKKYQKACPHPWFSRGQSA